MTVEEFVDASHHLSCVYEQDKIEGMTERQFIHKKMKYSKSHVDRSRYANGCIDELKNLMLSGMISVSCSDYLNGKSTDSQLRIYNILMEAKDEGNRLARDRIVIPVADAIKNNPNATWGEIKPTIRPLKNRKKKAEGKEINPDSTVATGTRFAQKVVELISGKEFAFAMKSTRQSWDFKEDAFAVDYDGKIYSIQCKFHSRDEDEGTCVEEAARGKINHKRDYAIAVISTSFSAKAKKLAENLGVILWDGSYLREHFGWDGRI